LLLIDNGKQLVLADELGHDSVLLAPWQREGGPRRTDIHLLHFENEPSRLPARVCAKVYLLFCFLGTLCPRFLHACADTQWGVGRRPNFPTQRTTWNPVCVIRLLPTRRAARLFFSPPKEKSNHPTHAQNC